MADESGRLVLSAYTGEQVSRFRESLVADRLENAWRVEDIDADVVARLAARHVPSPKAIELAVDIGHDRAAPT